MVRPPYILIFTWALHLQTCGANKSNCKGQDAMQIRTDQDNKAVSEEESFKFSKLINWMQEGLDTYVPEEHREGLRPYADTMELGPDRRVLAKRDIFDGELVLRIPLQRLMHSGYYMADSQPGEPRVAPKETGEHVNSKILADLGPALEGKPAYLAHQTWLAVYLMEHRRLGSQSAWSPYLDFLPRDFPALPLRPFFQPERWSLLKGSRFVQRAKTYQTLVDNQYDQVEKLLPEIDYTYTRSDYAWARAVISTRAFAWNLPGLPKEDDTFMVPIGDMFNHRVGPPQTEWIFNQSTRTFDYRALKKIYAGDEVLVSYGPKGNSDFILNYGFAVQNVSGKNAASTVLVQIPLDDEVEHREDREQWLKQVKARNLGNDPDEALEPPEFELKATLEGSDVQDMFGYARLISLPSANLVRRVQQGSCSQDWPPKCKRIIGLANERAMLKRLARIIDTHLDAYPTSVEQDENLIPSLSGVPLNFVLLRRDEKVVLRWWKRFLKLMLEWIDLEPAKIEKEAIKEYGSSSHETQYARMIGHVKTVTLNRKKRTIEQRG
eukprot:TRINITY_DN24636_c0_g1_i1.p1 TRINITY_DN24636_c0_g1~~TRINITY_DN24636_c0_g1_i1.p1  ORF type:complete len:578 (-),score=73.39 TRINITY_DN24636_c0_g1_i1:371-2020(-)